MVIDYAEDMTEKVSRDVTMSSYSPLCKEKLDLSFGAES